MCKLRYHIYSELNNETRQKIKDGDKHAVNPIKGFSASDISRLACYKSQLPTTDKDHPWTQVALVCGQQELEHKKCEFCHPYKGSEGIALEAVADKQVRNMENNNMLIVQAMARVIHRNDKSYAYAI